MTTTIVNLTSHELVIHSRSHEQWRVPPSGTVARVEETRHEHPGGVLVRDYDPGFAPGEPEHKWREWGWTDPPCTLPVTRVEYGPITGLPAPKRGVVYVVSAMVAQRAAREDVMSPGPLVRDDAGRPVGCRGLTAWAPAEPEPKQAEPDGPVIRLEQDWVHAIMALRDDAEVNGDTGLADQCTQALTTPSLKQLDQLLKNTSKKNT